MAYFTQGAEMRLKLDFKNEWGWSGGYYSVAFYLTVRRRRILCLVSGLALQEYFGASKQPLSMEDEFFANRELFEGIARKLISEDAFTEEGRIFIGRPEVAAALAERAAATANP